MCNSGNVTAHGQWDTILIENNTITEPAWNGSCYGISITAGYADVGEYFRNVTIRNNTLVNVGCGVCANSAPGIVIENNRIFNTLSSWTMGIFVPVHSPAAGDAANANAVIRNNTVCYTIPTLDSSAFITTAASIVTGNAYRTGLDASTGVCAR
jgi:hypothetical protein